MTESSDNPSPGVSRDERISDDGLLRLEKQLQHGARMAKPVRAQWVRRYGDAAREVLKQYAQYDTEFDNLN